MRLIQGDCLKIMEDLIEEGVKVDLILTDPPYGTVKGLKLDGWGEKSINWDNEINPRIMFHLCENLLREKGTLILFSQEPYTQIIRTNTHNNLPFLYPMIWLKDHFANSLSSKKAPVNYFEDINIFRKKYDSDSSNPLRKYAQNILNFIGLSYKEIENRVGHRKLEHFFYRSTSLQFSLVTREMYELLIKEFDIQDFEGFLEYDELLNINANYSPVFNINGKYKSNILEYRKDHHNKLHPTQKPVQLLEDLIKTYTNPGDLVLDFTMGSGSTGVACNNLERDFIGIELDENYFKIAEKRLDENMKQTKLNFNNPKIGV